MTTGQLIDGYLTRLRDAAAVLPPPRRAELVAEVAEHIETAVEGPGGADEIAVRNVLDRLGSPEEIVAAEIEGDGVPGGRPAGAGGFTATAPASSGRRPREFRIVVAAILLVLGVLLVLIASSQGPGSAIVALSVAVLTPYVWIPIVVAGMLLAAQRSSLGRPPAAEAPGEVARRRRPPPWLFGLVGIAVLLLAALAAEGPFFMGMVAVLALPLVVLMLLIEVRRAPQP